MIGVLYAFVHAMCKDMVRFRWFFPGDVEHPPLMAGEWAHARWTSGCAYEVSAVASVRGALVLAEMQVTRIALVDGI